MASSVPLFNPSVLKGKTAFVTGGGTGICYTITQELLKHGCNAVIVSRNFERLKAAAEKLEKDTGAKCIPIRMDVRNVKGIEDAVDKAIEIFGKIDILINGAAGNFLSPASQLTPNAFQTVMQIDAIGTFNVSQIVYNKSMRKNGGSIINITATLHWNGEYLQVHAGAAKAAIEGMSKHLANEWGRHHVRVNNIAPGPIADTEGYKRLGGFLPKELLEKMRTNIPLQRLGTRGDVANVAIFLASDASSYITGTTIVVDGGAWMAGNGMVAFAMPDVMSKL